MAPPSVIPMGSRASTPTRGRAIGLMAGPAMPNVVAPYVVSEEVGRSEAGATPATRSIETESPTGGSSARALPASKTSVEHTPAARDDRLMDPIIFVYRRTQSFTIDNSAAGML